MDNLLKKGRALQLEGLSQAPIKVTIGFKCAGSEKIALANEAYEAEMTLSEYVECLVSIRHEQSERIREANSKAENLHVENKQLLERLFAYESHPRLQQLLKANLGKTVSIRNPGTDQQADITINEVVDVFQVMVHSFKTN